MTPTSDARTSSQSGFTLLELLVVLAIIMIVTGLVVPNIATSDNSAFNAQIRRAVAALTYARRIAIVESSPRVAEFYALDPDSRDYEDLLEELEAKPQKARWVSEQLSISFQSELNQDPEPVEHVDVTFFPQGGSTGGVLNFSQDERSAMVRIDPITGRIATAYGGDEFGDAH